MRGLYRYTYPTIFAQHVDGQGSRQGLAVNRVTRRQSLYSGAQCQGNVPDGRIGRALLFNQFDAVGIDFQRFCSLAHEERIQRYAKYLCGPFWRATIAEERFVTRGKANRTLALAHLLKAASSLEFTSNRAANIYSDDVLQ